MRMCMEFRDEIHLKGGGGGGGGGGECEAPKNSNFVKNGKMVISVKIWNFSRSRMTTQDIPLSSSHEI